jgi:ribosomal protein S18 acetylase RimI-like enzyme
VQEALTLRLGGVADVAAIRQLTREAYAQWIPVIGREPLPMGADYDAAVRRHRFDLLYVGGVLAGLIETADQGERLYIENVAIAPAFQGRGLGPRLIAHAEGLARAQGRRSVALCTNQRFAANVALYLRLGFDIDGEVDLGAGTVRVDMSKALEP